MDRDKYYGFIGFDCKVLSCLKFSDCSVPGGDFNVGLVMLDEPSQIAPVQLYEGGDLGYTDCHRLKYVTAMAAEGEARVQQLDALHNEECDYKVEAETGFQSVTHNMLCAVPSSQYPPHIMPGSPLLVPWKGSSTGMIQIGVHVGGIIYTRVSEMLQWIVSAPGLGKHPTLMLNLEITHLSLPPGGTVSIYNGASESAKTSWHLDSNCDAGESYIDEGTGAMLVVVEGPAFQSITLEAKLSMLGCAAAEVAMSELESTKYGSYADMGDFGVHLDQPMYMGEKKHCMKGCMLAECVDGPFVDSNSLTCADYAAREYCVDGEKNPEDVWSMPTAVDLEHALTECCVCGGGKGLCDDSPCEFSLTWPNITSMSKLGKSFTGGLGQKAERSSKGQFGVWACVRDWDDHEMLTCGVGPKQLACFRFDERAKEFSFYGTNDEVKLVAEEAVRDGFMKEEELLAMIPSAHHDPAPFLN